MKYSDPSGNSPIGEFVASTICTIMNNAYEINLLGVLSGITNATVTGLLGGSDMDITKSFIDGYLFGAMLGIGMVLLAAAVTDALVLAKFYAITATAGSALSVGAAIYAIMNHNKRAAIVYGVLAVMSIFNMAQAYNYYCEVWLIGEKGVAAFSTAEFSAAKGMSESGRKTASPYDLEPTHPQTKSNRQMNKLTEQINADCEIKETIKYVEYNGKKYVVDGHHRLIVAKRLRFQEVPIEEVQLPYKGYNTIDDLLRCDEY